MLATLFLECSHPKTGEDEPILTIAYFSKGLVQPPTRVSLAVFECTYCSCFSFIGRLRDSADAIAVRNWKSKLLT